jgi:hypothetical protein
VLKHATRWRRLQQTADAADTGPPGLAREAGEQAAIEGQQLVLMAQCLFLVAFLRKPVEAAGMEHVSAGDVAAMLITLADLSSGAFAQSSACTDSTALAVLFAALAVLERGKLSEQGCLSLQSSVHFLPDRHDARSALLRLALALSSDISAEPLLQTACDDGAFGFLLELVQSPAFQVLCERRGLQRHARVAHAPLAVWQDEARGDDTFALTDAYVLTAHTLVTTFLKDNRGRNQARAAFAMGCRRVFRFSGAGLMSQRLCFGWDLRLQVKRMRETKHAAFTQLLHILAALYEQVIALFCSALAACRGRDSSGLACLAVRRAQTTCHFSTRSCGILWTTR